MRNKKIIIDETVDLTQILGLDLDYMQYKDFMSDKEDYEKELLKCEERIARETEKIRVFFEVNKARLQELEDLMELKDESYSTHFQSMTELVASKPEGPSREDVDLHEVLIYKITNYNWEDHELMPGTDYVLIGQKVFGWVKDNYHLGLRNINYPDACSLDLVHINEGDINILFSKGVPNAQNIAFFKSEEFKPKEYPLERSEILKDLASCIAWLSWFDQYIETMKDIVGFDYETNKFPLELGFRNTGFSLSTDNIAAFFSLTELRFRGEEEAFMPYFRDFCRKHDYMMWAFNSGFEDRATYHMLREHFFFEDAQVINILEERNKQPKSLKFTTVLLFQTASWDDEFDFLKDKLEDLFDDSEYTENWRILKYPDIEAVPYQDEIDEVQFVPATEDTIEISSYVDAAGITISISKTIPGTPEVPYQPYVEEVNEVKFVEGGITPWGEIMARFPTYESEFIRLFEHYWGSPFECIPADILGAYCNKDSQYTKMIGNHTRANFTPDCIAAFQGNIQIGSRLATVGIIKDEAIQEKYANLALNILSHSSYFISTFALKIDKANLGPINNMDDYDPFVLKLIDLGLFDDNYVKMFKDLARRYWNDDFEFGVDDNKLVAELGEEFKEKFLEEVDDIVGELDEDVFRKRKLFTTLADWYEDNYELPDELAEKHEETMRSQDIHYKLEQLELAKHQFTNIAGVPNKIDFEGEMWDRQDFIDYLKSDFFNIASNEYHDDLQSEIMKRFGPISAYYRMVHDISGEEELYELLGLEEGEPSPNSFEEDFATFKAKFNEIEQWERDAFLEMLQLEGTEWNDTCHKVSPIQLRFKNNHPKDYENFLEYFNNPEIGVTLVNDFLKVNLCIRMFKKYSKSYGTYVDGMMNSDIYVSPLDENMVSFKEGEYWTQGKGVSKFYPRFNVCTAATKRWSSPFHTIPSKNDAKRIISSPDHTLMSYFDISQAEVRTIAYMSNDTKMVEWYESGVDLYIETGKLMYPDADMGFLKKVRADMKVVLLADFYGESAKSTAGRIFKSVEFTMGMKKQLSDTFHIAKKWCLDKTEYCVENEAVDTILGDWVTLEDYQEYALRTRGANMCVQGFTAVVLAAGFNNILKEAKKAGIVVQPIICVHDAAINYFEIKDIWFINEFYYEHFTMWLYNKYGIKYEFSTFYGVNYHDLVEARVTDNNVMTLEGTDIAIKQILERFDRNGFKYQLEMKNPIVEPKELRMEEVFLKKGGSAYYELDSPYNTATLTRVD